MSLIFFVSFLLKGCSSPEVKGEDITGIWKADDGAIIELKKDSTYTAKQINYNNIYSGKEYENKRFDFSGNWKMINNAKHKRKIIELHSSSTFSDYGIDRTYTINGKVNSHKIGFSLEMSGHGLLENKPPWYLFVWIGDPDEMNKYRFVKQ